MIININTDNAAFKPFDEEEYDAETANIAMAEELRHIFKMISVEVEIGRHQGEIKDSNGNHAGHWRLK